MKEIISALLAAAVVVGATFAVLRGMDEIKLDTKAAVMVDKGRWAYGPVYELYKVSFAKEFEKSFTATSGKAPSDILVEIACRLTWQEVLEYHFLSGRLGKIDEKQMDNLLKDSTNVKWMVLAVMPDELHKKFVETGKQLARLAKSEPDKYIKQ